MTGTERATSPNLFTLNTFFMSLYDTYVYVEEVIGRSDMTAQQAKDIEKVDRILGNLVYRNGDADLFESLEKDVLDACENLTTDKEIEKAIDEILEEYETYDEDGNFEGYFAA